MSITRWRPFGEVMSMQREFNRLFDNLLQGQDDASDYHGVWKPDVDIKEKADEIIITAELPGMKKEDIKLTIHDNVLQICGEKKREAEEKDESYHRVERIYGSFSRTFTLPSLVEASKIEALFKDGILQITLPKSEKAKPKEIDIKMS